MVNVGEVEKQRWNGYPTGDGRVEHSFVKTGWDGLLQDERSEVTRIECQICRRGLIEQSDQR